MPTSELLNLLNSLQAEAGRSTMDFVTVLFGYLVCAHFIGAGLSRAYVLLLTALYTLFCTFPLAGTTVAMTTIAALNANHQAGLSALGLADLHAEAGVAYVPAATYALAWLMSLGYMYRVRKAARS